METTSQLERTIYDHLARIGCDCASVGPGACIAHEIDGSTVRIWDDYESSTHNAQQFAAALARLRDKEGPGSVWAVSVELDALSAD